MRCGSADGRTPLTARQFPEGPMQIAKRVVSGVLFLSALTLPAPASAQDSKSAPLAKQLAAAMEAAKLDSIAAKDAANADVFYAALYFPGQLLVISGKYSVPQLLNDRLGKKEYRDVYMDLNGAAAADSKLFIQDPGADGIRAKRDENQPFDIVEVGGKQTMFNSDWKAQKLSEQDYQKTFSDVDDRYAQILSALLAQVKKTS
ncbi:MAG TPA: hypothetical protein VKD69_25070 [Vicinamibacterales bacterium]|nr:hypothetical protein [Vicinamibacterales bacterium]